MKSGEKGGVSTKIGPEKRFGEGKNAKERETKEKRVKRVRIFRNLLQRGENEENGAWLGALTLVDHRHDECFEWTEGNE